MTRLAWEGCLNMRDLGGLPADDGRVTRSGAIVRGDSPDRLTTAGWAALREYGIRTIVDLRNEDELGAVERRTDAAVIHLPLDGIEEDRVFWERWGSGPQFGTPLYYRPHLERFPGAQRASDLSDRERAAGRRADSTRGRPRPHGPDRDAAAVAGGRAARDDRRRLLASGPADADVERFLTDRGTSAADLIVTTLAELDVESHLCAAGLTDTDLSALRARLLAEPE